MRSLKRVEIKEGQEQRLQVLLEIRQKNILLEFNREDLKVQLTLEPHGFELHEFTYMCIFFSINIQLALNLPEFHIRGFKQLQIKNSILELQLEIHG